MLHNTYSGNMRSMNKGKLESAKQEEEFISIAVLGTGELKWTGVGYIQSDNYEVFYSGNDKFRTKGVAPIMRQDVAQAVRGYNAKSDHIISIRLCGKLLA